MVSTAEASCGCIVKRVSPWVCCTTEVLTSPCTMSVQSTTAAPAAAQSRSPEPVQRTTAAPAAAQHRETNEVQSVVAALECAR